MPRAGLAPHISARLTRASFVKQRENPDPNIRYIAYAKLGSPSLYEDQVQKDEAVRIMVGKLEDGREPVAIRAAIIRSLGNLGDRRAREVILRGVSDTDNAVIRVEACRALGKVGLPEDATTLARIMMVDKLEDCRIAAIEAIGSLKSHEPRIYQILIEGMDHEDPAIRYQCLQSLRKITEKDYGVDPEVWRRELQPVLAGTATDTRPRSRRGPWRPRKRSPPRPCLDRTEDRFSSRWLDA